MSRSPGASRPGGGRIAFIDGADLVAARMYTDLDAIRRGWTKNLYRLRGRRPLAALASVLELAVTLVWPAVAWVGAVLAGPAGSGWLAALALGRGPGRGGAVPGPARR